MIFIFLLAVAIGAGLEETQDFIPSENIVPVNQTEVGK